MKNFTDSQKNLTYLIALHAVDGLGSVRLKRLIDHFGDLKSAWEASDKEIRNLGIPQATIENLKNKRKELDPEEYFARITDSGIKILTWFDKDYPESLKNIYSPPIILYYKGEFKVEDVNAIAVVGTRKLTGYGRIVTEKFSTELSQAGLTIISGLASGVDTIAHQSALKAGGRTIAILGGGLNRIFPSSNIDLSRKIVEGPPAGGGVVVSEFPPEYPSLAGNFPARNRIVAGLSLGVLVTEAAEDSGSLITARFGLDQGKSVFAVPGPITSDLSKGPADLIKDGAKLVYDVQDVLDELGIDRRKSDESDRIRAISQSALSEMEKQILECLENEEKHVDEIVRSLHKSSAEISGTLIKLEILGIVKNLGSGVYTKLA